MAEDVADAQLTRLMTWRAQANVILATFLDVMERAPEERRRQIPWWVMWSVDLVPRAIKDKRTGHTIALIRLVSPDRRHAVPLVEWIRSAPDLAELDRLGQQLSMELETNGVE